MPIYKINLNPYTITKDDINLTYIENKRYTMRDIGLLEQRITNLEYYTSLSILEKTATDMVIKDGNGLDRTKNGVLVDNFFTHGIGDVWNSDYFVSMDKMYGAAAPPVNTTMTKFFVAEHLNTQTGKKMTTLDYTETPAIVQPYATKSITIQPYQVAKYIGVMVMDPPADFWTDQQKAPDLVININGENDNTTIGHDQGHHTKKKRDHAMYAGGIIIPVVHDGTIYNRTIAAEIDRNGKLRSYHADDTRAGEPDQDNTVWNTGRGNITSSWFGRNAR